jgi:eukaryotic translation initiation factor 2C
MEHLNYRTYNRETDTESYKFPSTLPLRPGVNTAGKAIQIRVNQFKVAQWPTKDVYQYDVSFHLPLQTSQARSNINPDSDWQWC